MKFCIPKVLPENTSYETMWKGARGQEKGCRARKPVVRPELCSQRVGGPHLGPGRASLRTDRPGPQSTALSLPWKHTLRSVLHSSARQVLAAFSGPWGSLSTYSLCSNKQPSDGWPDVRLTSGNDPWSWPRRSGSGDVYTSGTATPRLASPHKAPCGAEVPEADARLGDSVLVKS